MVDGIARVLRNSLLSLVSDAVARASNTVLFILISRWLGAAEGGIYALALTYALLFTQLSFWGMDQLLTREVAKNRALASKFAGNFILIRCVVSLALLFFLLVIVECVGYAPRTSATIAIVGFSVVTESLGNICQALFFAYEKMEYSTTVGLTVGTLRIVGGTLVLLLGGRVETVAVILLICSVIGFVLNLWFVYRHFPKPSWRLDFQFWFSQLKTAVPFVLIGIFYIVEFQNDTLLLSVLRSEKDVGIYSAATTILFALALVPQAFRAAIFPVMTRLHAVTSPMLGNVYEKSFKYLMLISLPVAAVLTMLANTIVHVVFRSEFGESVPTLQVVIWTFVLLMINVPTARLMVVAGVQGVLALFQGCSMVLNLCLNAALIPGLGAVGAAWARVGSTSLFVVSTMIYTCWKLYRWNPLPMIVRFLAALLVMMVLSVFLCRFGEVVAVLGGLVAYAMLVWGLRFISPDERSILVRVCRRII